MDCQAIERYQAMPQRRMQGWRFLVAHMLHALRPSYPKLDLEVMSDYMKRDMGFMDGRDPRQDSDLTR